MEKRSIFCLFPILVLVALCFSATRAAEEPYPNRPINLVISYAPGGVLDRHGRILGDRLSEFLGQPIVRVHKPGGGGTLGASFAARAKPDGYTLLVGTSANLVFSPIVKKVDYTWEDFVSIGIYCKGAVCLYVKNDAKWETLQDFVVEARKRQLKVSSYGKLTHADFVIEGFSKQAGIKLAHIPYKSCAEAVTALLGGHVDADFCGSSMGPVEAGAVRILAIADHERSKVLPDVKTFKEQGYPVALPLWYTFCVPRKTPRPIVDKLSSAMQEVFKRYGKEIQESLIKLEFTPHFLDSRQSLTELRRDYESTFKTVKDLGWIDK